MRALAALALLLALGPVGQAADDEAALKDQVLRLNEITGADPALGKIVELLEDKPAARKLLAAAVKIAKAKDQPLNINATWILASTAQGLKDTEAAELFYRINIEQGKKLLSGRHLVQAYTGLIATLYEARKFDESEKVCKEFLDLDLGGEAAQSLDRAKPSMQRRMILIMVRQGQAAKALELVDRMLKRDPENWLTLELKGQVLRQAGQYEEAAKVYNDLLDRIAKDTREGLKEAREEFANDIRYTLSGVYVDMNQIGKAEEQLRALLAKHPNNPTYNNDLGYILADHDMKLEESEKLVRKALEEDRKQRKANPDLRPDQDKDNPAYLDSLGWVLFKQKKYQEAKKYLEQAVAQEDGRHLEIYEHLGDTCMALGEKKQAADAYKKALESATESRRDQARKAELEKKMKAAAGN